MCSIPSFLDIPKVGTADLGVYYFLPFVIYNVQTFSDLFL